MTPSTAARITRSRSLGKLPAPTTAPKKRQPPRAAAEMPKLAVVESIPEGKCIVTLALTIKLRRPGLELLEAFNVNAKDKEALNVMLNALLEYLPDVLPSAEALREGKARRSSSTTCVPDSMLAALSDCPYCKAWPRCLCLLD
ncbi:hypothetical protein AURDEDRAFT_177918 [Auricularia subglabra TFB-10046 SS5]|uniref:Uncharacterized protein n=1 Tax=Auricularia subglabra (strain TFB-10046 / SS5) TaxID=717982 RepID=J0WL22_AURST|nr:hypothetical protein AURDEDRAFT_177918 [Auricularia subglabra TFB-10046 SS5]